MPFSKSGHFQLFQDTPHRFYRCTFLGPMYLKDISFNKSDEWWNKHLINFFSHSPLVALRDYDALSPHTYPPPLLPTTTKWTGFFLIWRIHIPTIVSLSTLKACNTVNWPGGAAISLYMLDSPLTYAVYHCECALMQKQRQIFNYLHFRDTIWNSIIKFRYANENILLSIWYVHVLIQMIKGHV